MNSTKRFENYKNKLASLRQIIVGKCELMAVGLAVVAFAAPPAVGQSEPESGDTVTVTQDSSTWLQEGPVNAITIGKGSDGVTVNNSQGGVITSADATAIETSADTTINNFGNIFGGFNGVDFRNGFGSGVLNNGATGSISSNSRAVNIGGSVDLTTLARFSERAISETELSILTQPRTTFRLQIAERLMLVQATRVLDSQPSCLHQVLTSPLITLAKLLVAAMQVLAWRLRAMASAWKEHELAERWMDRLLVCSLAKSTTAVPLAQKVLMARSEDFELLMA